MPRTVDPERHETRRLHIIDAALTAFAENGFERSTTAAICRAAGISSGTFFHYFPTKASVLVAILELGSADTLAWFQGRPADSDPRTVLVDYLDRVVAEARDPRVAGFVSAVGGVAGQPDVAEALAVDDQVTRDGLRQWVTRGQQAGQVRSDWSAERLTNWLFLLIDGFLGRIATDPHFTADGEGPALLETADRLLRPE